MLSFAHYHYRVPQYHYHCARFLYYSSCDPEWFIMDDFGNAVHSDISYCAE